MSVDIARNGPSAIDCLEAAMRADPALTVQKAIMTVPIAGLETGYGCCAWGLVEAGGCNCGSPADASVGYMHERLCGWEPCPNGCWDRLHPETPEGAPDGT